MSILNNSLLLGADAAAGGYQIQRSLRFNSSDSAYCGRTFITPTTQGTFTFATWIKRAALGTTQHLFGVSTNHRFGFTSGNALNLTFAGSSALTTTALFRDPSAWYHIVWTQSGTSHTLYVNNVSVGTATATSSVFNTAVAHQIGAANTANYFSGYLADIHFIDGQALTPSSFGEFDTNGVWQPKAYAGTYGTNGFRLPFSDNSAATATTLGKDAAGSNNWTPNNLSVTAGAGNDSLVDSPTNYGTDTGAGGEVRGNYCTLNPLAKAAAVELTDGNLRCSASAASWNAALGTIGLNTGKWYFEMTLPGSTAAPDIGWHQLEYTTAQLAGFANNVRPGSYCVALVGSGSGVRTYNNGVETAISTGTWSTNDVVGCAIDMDTKRIWFSRNGTWYPATTGGAVGSPSAGTNPTLTYTYSGVLLPRTSAYSTTYPSIVNFGQRPFAYTAPSGFKALTTANLPTPTIANGATVMDVKLYTGNGSTQTISGLNFSPDLVWIKGRSGATDHALYDVVRGTQARLESNTTDVEATSDSGLTAFNSDGFALGSQAQVNTNTATYAAWCWDESVSAGFDIVTYTGNGSNRTIAHGLGVAPSMMLFLGRNNTQNNGVYHVQAHRDGYINPAQQVHYLNSSTLYGSGNIYPFNATQPSSTVFSLSGGTFSFLNVASQTFVVYCFAPVENFSSFGFYVGDGAANGPFTYLGFRPAFLLIKGMANGNWTILDDKREGYNVDNNPLFPNLSNAEGTTDLIDITSNGFKVRSTDASVNSSAVRYIYAAWASSPFAYSRAR